jgi:hypothetical protein
VLYFFITLKFRFWLGLFVFFFTFITLTYDFGSRGLGFLNPLFLNGWKECFVVENFEICKFMGIRDILNEGFKVVLIFNTR